jgi:hypothetical protein
MIGPDEWVRVCRKCQQTLPLTAQYCWNCGHITIHDAIHPPRAQYPEPTSAWYDDERFTTASHICCLYHTEAEHQTALSRFIHHSLVQQKKIIVILDQLGSTPLLNVRTRAHTFEEYDITPAITRGQLTFYTIEDIYLASGAFNPTRTITWFAKETSTALNEGYTGLSVTSDMTWAQRHAIPTKQIIAYETVVDDFLLQHPCRGLCRYDRWMVPFDTLADIIPIHPLLISQGQMYVNPHHGTFRDLLRSLEASDDEPIGRTQRQGE